VDKALLCQKAEHDYAGMPCGIMDQFISVMGKKDHLLLLDCRSRKPELVPMSDPSMALLIINTNVKHELTGGEYAKRRAQCEQAAKPGVLPCGMLPRTCWMRARGKMEEVVFRRAGTSSVRLSGPSMPPRGARLQLADRRPAHVCQPRSLRDDYEVSCPELDAVVDIAEAIGPKAVSSAAG
jgi:galactokinase